MLNRSCFGRKHDTFSSQWSYSGFCDIRFQTQQRFSASDMLDGTFEFASETGIISSDALIDPRKVSGKT